MSAWPHVALRRIFRVVNGGTPTSESENWDGGVAWATPVDLGRHNGSLLRTTQRNLSEEGLLTGSAAIPAGCLVLSTRAPIGYVSQTVERTAFNQGCRGLIPRAKVDIRFFRYALASSTSALQASGQGSTFMELSTESVGSAPVPIPRMDDQRAIADFLDAETARIDALIAKLLLMRGLANERWHTKLRAIANDPRWVAVPLRRLWDVIDCKHLTPSYLPEGYPVISPGDVQPGRLDLRVAHRFVNEVDYARLTEGSRRPRRGDIVYSRNASIGIAAYVNTDEPFTMGQDVCLIRSESEDQLWLMYMLNSVGVDQLAEMKVGSTLDRINISQLRELVIPVPPHDHQSIAARRIDIEAQKMSRMQEALDNQLRLLSDRRQAVITSAIAGELDIPGVAA
jgi:type I restriction enzyme, S subunit